MNSRKLSVLGLALLGLFVLARAETDAMGSMIDDIEGFLESIDVSTSGRVTGRSLQQAPTYPGEPMAIGSQTLDVPFERIANTIEAFRRQIESALCPSILAAVPDAISCQVTAIRAGSVIVEFRLTFKPGTSPAAVQAAITTASSPATLVAALSQPAAQAFVTAFGVTLPKLSPPPSLTPPELGGGGSVPCPSCAKQSPPPASPPASVASPPPPPPPPVVSTAPCKHCGKPTVSTPTPTPKPSHRPVTKPSHRPVTKPSHRPVTKPSHKPVTNPSPKPVSNPSPKPVSNPSPKPVSNPSPKPVTKPSPKPVTKPSPKPKGPACGTTTRWTKVTRGRRSRWVRRTTKNYCPAGQKCCKVPSSWGKKSWGPKSKRGRRHQLRCYKKCPNCWY